MNLKESIKKILRESLESEWNEGNYDYQHGFCHYFAYNIIDKIRERFPKKKVNYYLLLANEVNKDTDEVEQDYLLHAYIKIGDKLLDSNGFTTMDEVEQRVNDWYNRQLTMTPEEYDINVWEEESDEIPEMFFNNRFCNTKRVKEDMDKFLSHPSVKKLFKDTLNESVPPQVRRRQEEFDRIFLHYRDSFIGHEYRVFKSFWNLLMESSLETLYHALFKKTVSDDNWDDSEKYIIDYLIEKYYDKTKQMWEKKHHKRLNESEDNEEKKIQKNLRAIRVLLDTIEVEGLCEIWVEYNPEDGDYEIRSKTTRKYLDMADMVRELKYIDDTIRSWKLKTYVYSPWNVENCEDEVEFLNESYESKTSQHLKIINNLLEPLKEKDCICDIRVFFDIDDNDYNVYLVFSQEELHDKFSDVMGIRNYITEMMNDVKNDLESFLPIRNIFIGYYTKPNCEWSPLNESEDSKQERKFTKLLNNIKEYLNSNSYDSVVRFMVDYDEVMDDVIVNIFFNPEDAVKLGGGINSVIKKTGKKIMEDLSVFPFDFKYHIHFEKPQLNESETKTNSSLHKLLNVLFDGFDNADYDWANYMCGMGECCDPYAIGFTLPDSDYDDYIFKLVDGDKYDDDGDYPKEFRDELPEPCYQQPDIKDPRFDTIVFYGLYAEEIEDYMGTERNWKSDLLKIINKQFGCEAKRIIII